MFGILELERVFQVSGNGLALVVLVGSQVDRLRSLGGGLEPGQPHKRLLKKKPWGGTF